MKQDVIDVSNSHEIGVMRDPNLVLKEAKKAAVALMEVVKQKKKPVIMNGEQYIEFEDWQILGQFYGVSAKVTATEFIELGSAKGFNAKADLIRNSDGMVLSSAEAMCLNDEDKWSTRTKYEYVNQVKTKVGEVPVPMFQLKSMAQTRACAKALRNKLAWVAVLAGFKPNVAEEMTGDENNGAQGKPHADAPQETELKYVDIIALAQAKKGEILNVQGYLHGISNLQVGAKKTDKTEYIVGDLPKDPTVKITIGVWGKHDAGAGQLLKFNQVIVGEYNNAPQYMAKESLT